MTFADILNSSFTVVPCIMAAGLAVAAGMDRAALRRARRDRLAREQAFAVALGERLAGPIRETIERRAEMRAGEMLAARTVLAPVRGSNGRFVKRGAAVVPVSATELPLH